MLKKTTQLQYKIKYRVNPPFFYVLFSSARHSEFIQKTPEKPVRISISRSAVVHTCNTLLATDKTIWHSQLVFAPHRHCAAVAEPYINHAACVYVCVYAWHSQAQTRRQAHSII